jgi:subtilisin family serine protease
VSACGQADSWWRGDVGSRHKPSATTPGTPSAPDPSDQSGKPIAPDAAGSGVAIVDLPLDDSALVNTDAIVERLGLASYHRAGFHGQGLKIAVLDNGFAGLNHSLGRRLPPTTRLLKAPRPDMQVTSHGVKLAEIAYAAATGSPFYQSHIPGPEILLVNTNGYTNFVDAVDQVIAEHVDIVLYAQVWEYGGNHDGGGFINAQVRRALAAGVLWVNAVGNLGQGTWSGPVRLDERLEAALPFAARGHSYARFTVPQDMTPVKLVLAWNDFDDAANYRTPQDLDVIVEAEDGTEIAAGRLIQDGRTDPAQDARYSAHAREIVQLTLHPGTYFARVVAKSTNFDAFSRLRLTVDGFNVKMLDPTTDDTVLIPADNPDVLTIGASDVDYSGRKTVAGRRVKPELRLPSLVTFADGVTHRGTSAATALAVGALAVFRSAYGAADRAALVDLARRGIVADSAAGEADGFLLRLCDYSKLLL